MKTEKHQSCAAHNVAMTMFRVESLNRWQERLMAAATGGGLMAIRKGPGCLLWNPGKSTKRSDALKYVDGVQVSREWVGPGIGALTFIPRRIYFENQSGTPSSKPEWMLTGNRKPSLPPPAKRIRTCLDSAALVGEHMPGFDPVPMPVGRVRAALHEKTRMIFGGGGLEIAGRKVSLLLPRHGFHTVPADMLIELVAESDSNEKVRSYGKMLADAFLRCKCQVRLSVISYDAMQKRLANCGQAIDQMRQGYCALIAVTGRKGEPLSGESNALIETMQAAGVPFRMFSMDNASLRWAALDQVGSLLMGAGGIPYALQLPWPEGVEEACILGVDLGHPKADHSSRVVMSLMDSRGVLIESWRHRQARDETISPAVLKAGLSWARRTAREHNSGHETGFLVIRDGRLHDGERLDTYRSILGRRMTFVELAKYKNPEMFIQGAVPCPVPAGTECLIEGSVTPFIVPVAPRLANDLSHTLKLHMAPRWDGLGLGLDTVSELVVGLSYTPGLGLATHALPGPIYWADGIAAIGETNHQFSGQRMCRLEL